MDKPDVTKLSDRQAIHDLLKYTEELEAEVKRLNNTIEELIHKYNSYNNSIKERQ